MASHVSAGVYWKEIDLSNYIPALSTTQFGVVGTASKGPINERTLISTVEQLVRAFGYPAASFPAIDAAVEYLKEGSQLWFVRVNSNTAPATVATSAVACLSGADVTITSKDKGSFYNSVAVTITNSGSKNAMDSKLGDGTATTFTLDMVVPYKSTTGATWANGIATLNFAAAHDIPVGSEITVSGAANTNYNGSWIVLAAPTPTSLTFSLAGTAIGAGAVMTVASVNSQYGQVAIGTVQILLDGAVVASDAGNTSITDTTLTEIGTTTFTSGTINYKTGVVSLTFATAPVLNKVVAAVGSFYSTFNMSFDKTIGGSTYTMESFKNLSIVSNSKSYYKEILARSNLIQVPTFVDTPLAGIYGMGGGTDGLVGIADSDYIGINTGTVRTGLQLLGNPDEIDINCFAIPGITSANVVQAMLSIAETRRDCMAIIDPPQGLAPQDVVDWANGGNAYAALNAINSSYAAIYYPWVQIYDSYNSVNRTIAPSGWIAAAFARTDNVADIWYAPAGAARGKVLGATGVDRILALGERDFLYENRVNPISDFVATGILIWGQRTSQVAPTALDRVNARRTLNYLEKIIVTAAQPLVFEPNNKYTWNRLVAMVQPYLDTMVNKGALYEAKVVCDKNTNTPDVIDRNEMVANIFLKIVKTAEVITLNFVLLSTGANIDEYIGRQF